jgi:anti-sigma-K factor RskA
MTDSRDTTENSKNNDDDVDMDPRYENLAAYVLDALDQDDERESVENLIDNDPSVAAEYRELAEAADHLAIGVLPVAPPVQLKSRIMELASRDSTPVQYAPQPVARIVPWWTRAFRSGVATSAVAAVLVLVVAGFLTAQNNQLSNEIDSLRSELTAESTAIAIIKSDLSNTLSDSETKVASMKTDMDQMEDEFGATTKMVVHQEEMVSELATANMALRQALRDQSWLTYVTMRRTTSSQLGLPTPRHRHPKHRHPV